jgi:hypothetical protein
VGLQGWFRQNGGGGAQVSVTGLQIKDLLQHKLLGASGLHVAPSGKQATHTPDVVSLAWLQRSPEQQKPVPGPPKSLQLSPAVWHSWQIPLMQRPSQHSRVSVHGCVVAAQ